MGAVAAGEVRYEKLRGKEVTVRAELVNSGVGRQPGSSVEGLVGDEKRSDWVGVGCGDVTEKPVKIVGRAGDVGHGTEMSLFRLWSLAEMAVKRRDSRKELPGKGVAEKRRRDHPQDLAHLGYGDGFGAAPYSHLPAPTSFCGETAVGCLCRTI